MNKKTVKEIGEIYCDAKNCVYNEGDHKCMAGSISVGSQNACSCNETLCATFTLSDTAR